jgi:glycosyltransferase involved in cell wall biosynthesis
MSLVTIAIPTFDRLEYLKEATASALAQTYRQIEILIGDDGPTKAIEEWASSVIARDGRVRYQRNRRNLGLAGNWNALADSARGEFLVIIGDDDRLLPDFVGRLTQVIQPAAQVAFSNHFVIDSAGVCMESESYDCTRRYGRDRLGAGEVPNAAAAVWQNSVPMSAALLRTRDVQQLRFKEDLNTPEIEFFARLANEGARFVFTPEYLTEYRTHEASATTAGLRSEALVKYLSEIPVPENVERHKRELMASLLIDATSRSLRGGDRESARQFLRHEHYPRTPRGWKQAMTLRAQEFCASLPAVLGCSAYRLMQRAKSAS